jgi:hypothetical protein
MDIQEMQDMQDTLKELEGRVSDMTYLAHSSKYSGRIQVGSKVAGSAAAFRFGESAEVWVDEDYSGKPRAEVSFSAIGSHSAEQGRRRAAAYNWAIEIAAELERRISEGHTLEQLLECLDVITRQKAQTLGLDLG